MAKAVGTSLPVSYKHSVEICAYVRGKNVETAKKLLDDAIQLKKAVPFRRFVRDVGHRKAMGSGRFPKKASAEIKKIIESAQKNAQFKGLSTTNLRIAHICAKQGESGWRYGRHMRRRVKRSHVEVILEETAKEEKKPKRERTRKKEDKK